MGVLRVYYNPIYHQEIINSAIALNFLKSFFLLFRDKNTQNFICVIFTYLFQLSIVPACYPL